MADVGCGHGASTIVMAQAYPIQSSSGSITTSLRLNARRSWRRKRGGDRITFAQASAKDFPAKDYDLVAFFDCLHDMATPWVQASTSRKRWPRMGRG